MVVIGPNKGLESAPLVSRNSLRKFIVCVPIYSPKWPPSVPIKSPKASTRAPLLAPKFCLVLRVPRAGQIIYVHIYTHIFPSSLLTPSKVGAALNPKPTLNKPSSPRRSYRQNLTRVGRSAWASISWLWVEGFRVLGRGHHLGFFQVAVSQKMVRMPRSSRGYMSYSLKSIKGGYMRLRSAFPPPPMVSSPTPPPQCFKSVNSHRAGAPRGRHPRNCHRF